MIHSWLRSANQSCSLPPVIRVSSNTLLFYWSWLEAIWSTTEAAGAAATQQEEVTCCRCQAAVFQKDLAVAANLANLALTNIPQPGCHNSLASLPSSRVLCWPKHGVCRGVGKSQLAEFLLPGWLHDPERECSSERTESITMYCTWRGREDGWTVWFRTKKHIQSSLSFTVCGHSLVRLKEEVESDKVRALAQTFIFVREVLTALYVTWIFEWVWKEWGAQSIPIACTTPQCKCKVMRRLHFKLFF